VQICSFALRSTSATVLLCALLESLPALAQSQLQANGRATLLTGADTNARRDYDPSLSGLDSATSLVLDGSARYGNGPFRAFGDLSVGGRKFLRLSSEDVLVTAGSLELELTPLQALSVSVLGTGKDRRGGERDYTDGAAQAWLTWAPDGRLQVRTRAGLHAFAYRPNPDYGFTAVEGGATVSWRFDSRHRLLGAVDVGQRQYPTVLRLPPGVADPGGLPGRSDGVLTASAGYEYRGPVRVRAEYSYFEQRSNSFGETNLRHRVSAQVGMRLPWEVTAVATAALQLTRFPDGIYLSSDVLLVQDEENANTLSLRFARPVSGHVDVELRYALFQYRLPQNNLEYLRQVAFVGVSARIGD
jgi:hypothetical protein